MPRSGPVFDPSEPERVYVPPEDEPEKPKKKKRVSLPGFPSSGPVVDESMPPAGEFQKAGPVTEEDISRKRGYMQRDIRNLSEMREDIDPEGWYEDPMGSGYIRGSDLISGYIDPRVSELSQSEGKLLAFETSIESKPYYKAVREPYSYSIYEDPELKKQYEQKVFEQQPWPTQLTRGIVGWSYYAMAVPFELAYGYITSPQVPYGRTFGVWESAKQIPEKERVWEQQLYEYGQKKDIFGATRHLVGSPTASFVYTYGAFSVAGGAINKIVPSAKKILGTGKSVFGKYVPKVVREYPSRFADVRLAREMWKGYQLPGWPSFVSRGRSTVLSSGRYKLDPFSSGHGSIWGGYGTSWKFYNAGLIDEISKPVLFPYEFVKHRPRWIETGRSYVALGDDVSFISRGYYKSYYHPKVKSDYDFLKPKRGFDITKAKRVFISDKVISAEYKTTPFSFKPTVISKPFKDMRDFSQVRLLLKRTKTKKGFIPDLYPQYFQKGKTFTGVEVETISNYWKNVIPATGKEIKPFSIDRFLAGGLAKKQFETLFKKELLPVSVSVVKPVSLTGMDISMVQRVDLAQRSSYNQMQSQLNKQAQLLRSQLSSELNQIQIRTPVSISSMITPQVPVLTPGPPSRPPKPSSKPFKIPILFPEEETSEKVGKRELGPGYQVMVKSRQYVHGKPRGREKYRPLTGSVFVYDDGMSVLGYVLDNSIAQSGYLKPVSRSAKPLKRVLPSRWSMLSHKFDFLKGKWTESRAHAIDTRGEVDELSAFRVWGDLPVKKQEQGFDIPNVNMDMYGFDKMKGMFDKMMRRLRL